AKGLNFGQFCNAVPDAFTATSVDFAETKGIAVAGTAASTEPTSSANPNATVTAICGATAAPVTEHVVRESKTPNDSAPGLKGGQISTPGAVVAFDAAWPIIQLYDFSGFPTDVTVDYHKSGGDQIVPLHFDRIPTNLISTSVDRTAYPVNTQVFVQLNDPQLNIDPTEENSWTWGANATNSTLYYQAFNRNGGADADGTAGMQNLIGNLTNFMFNHNGQFLLNPAAQVVNVVDFQKNGKEPLTSLDGTGRGQTSVVRTASIGLNSTQVTFIE